MASNTPFGHKCAKCPGVYSLLLQGVSHTTDCPYHPHNREKATDAAKPVSLDAVRFNNGTAPAHLDPRTALVAATEWIDGMDEKPSHVIVLVGRDIGTEGCSATRFFQAGTYRYHGQIGLCLEGMQRIRESGEE